jgi:hypothetical protein
VITKLPDRAAGSPLHASAWKMLQMGFGPSRFAFLEVHAFDETLCDGIKVPHLAAVFGYGDICTVAACVRSEFGYGLVKRLLVTAGNGDLGCRCCLR